MSKQNGFTLLELVIAIAIFALLGLASWTLFDGVVRVQRGTLGHEQALRSLQRAVSIIERDVLHSTDQPIVIEQTQLRFQRINWRNPLDQPRSEGQSLAYRLVDGVLWRESWGEGTLIVQRQKLLDDVRQLNWRLYDRQGGWLGDQHGKSPLALEMRLTAGRFDAIRRVLLLPGARP